MLISVFTFTIYLIFQHMLIVDSVFTIYIFLIRLLTTKSMEEETKLLWGLVFDVTIGNLTVDSVDLYHYDEFD